MSFFESKFKVLKFCNKKQNIYPSDLSEHFFSVIVDTYGLLFSEIFVAQNSHIYLGTIFANQANSIFRIFLEELNSYVVSHFQNELLTDVTVKALNVTV